MPVLQPRKAPRQAAQDQGLESLLFHLRLNNRSHSPLTARNDLTEAYYHLFLTIQCFTNSGEGGIGPPATRFLCARDSTHWARTLAQAVHAAPITQLSLYRSSNRERIYPVAGARVLSTGKPWLPTSSMTAPGWPVEARRGHSARGAVARTLVSTSNRRCCCNMAKGEGVLPP